MSKGFPIDLSIAECTRLTTAMIEREAAPDGRLALNPETIEQDLARLVLAILEFIRQLMELQAIRRMDAGTLDPDQEETLGLTLMRARDQIERVAAQFGLKPEDLALDLGPLGRVT